MESIAEETLHDILLKLPTRDVARCRCVCKPWRLLLATPSFRRLHARTVASSGGAEALLVSQARPQGKIMETSVLCVSSAKPMCRIVDLAEEYRIASVCNGFIVLSSGATRSPLDLSHSPPSWEPLFVCNPVIGEKLQVPAPPGLRTLGRHLFAMGFSASSHQYKLFRLPFEESSTDDNYLEVYTLDVDGGRWRQHPDLLRRHGIRWAGSPPVLVDGKIYVLTKRYQYAVTPNNILVIDVASEAYRTYPLMPVLPYEETSNATMYVFELAGQPCVAVHVPIPDHPDDRSSELHLWVMPTPEVVQGRVQHQLDKKLPGAWLRRYNFYCDRLPTVCDAPMGTWVEGEGILCCIIGDHLYRYDTTKDDNKHKDGEDDGGRFSAWDHKLRLPSPPDGFYERRGVYGGYRPTLLSPQDLAEQQHDNVDEQFEQSWLHALRFNEPSNVDNGSDQHVAKRRRIHS